MSIKKLSLAAAITVGLMTTGFSASTARCPDPCSPCPSTGSVRTPSSYGAGSAGTFKSYGTLKPWGGNSAGSTQISTFLSPVNKPTGAAASMAAKGNYGNCTICPQGTTGGAAATTGGSSITIEKETAPSSSDASVATPTTSSETGGAAEAKSQGMKCVDIPEKIPVTTGGATAICPTPGCVPGASSGTRGADAPKGFSDQDNPGAIAPFQETGGAAQATPVCPTPACPTTPACPSTSTSPSTISPPSSGLSLPSTSSITPSTGGASSITADDSTLSSANESTINPSTTSLSPADTSVTTDETPASPALKQVAPSTTSIIPTTPVYQSNTPTVPANPMLQSATTCPALMPSTTCPTGMPAGGAATIPQQCCPQAIPCPTQACPPQPCAPTGGAATIPQQYCPQVIPCPSQACPPQPCVPACVKPMPTSSTVIMPTTPVAASMPWQITGGAAGLTSQITATCPTSSANAQYIEKQTYSYPSMAGSKTTVVPTGNAVLGFNPSGGGVSVNNPINIPAQSNIVSFGGYSAYPTGAAAPVGCPSATPITAMPGAAVTKTLQTERSIPVTIQTSSGLTLQRYALVPGCPATTGAAAPVSAQFSDISQNYWASNAINRLASAGIVSGYPDRTFKPNLPVSRAEFASMLVQGLNLQNTSIFNQQIFKDVPTNYWANNAIDKVYNQGLIAGYPNNTFRPSTSISRAEALTTLSKAFPSLSIQMSAVNADQILSQYQDGAQVPTWAKIPVAQALKAGLLQNSQNPNMINPDATASRADIASMISNMRQALALEPQQPTGAVTGAAASVQQQTITVPAMSVRFNDDVSARTSNIGDKFNATTLEPVAINNVVYPIGSQINGRVVELLRPGNGQDGALKLAFSNITAPNGESAALPRDVLTAQVQKTSGKSLLTRLVEFPFVLPGRMVGTVGRTTGGMVVTAGNASEQVLGEGGAALGQVVARNYGAAGRNGIQSAVGLGQGVLGIVRTALNGGAGLLNLTSDEIGYLIGADGTRIARIVPRDTVSIAFGCLE